MGGFAVIGLQWKAKLRSNQTSCIRSYTCDALIGRPSIKMPDIWATHLKVPLQAQSTVHLASCLTLSGGAKLLDCISTKKDSARQADFCCWGGQIYTNNAAIVFKIRRAKCGAACCRQANLVARLACDLQQHVFAVTA
eukprot:scaffold144498_cov18-Tisochrysis_lutea.AAC.5